MKYKIFNILILLFSSQVSFSQIQNKKLTAHESGYLKTIQETVLFLKSKPTPKILFHESEFYSSEESFYDTFLINFFNREKMITSFKLDTMVFGVSGKFDMIRHILDSCDYYLDVVPKDSISFEPKRYSAEKPHNPTEKDLYFFENTFNVFFHVGAQRIKVLQCVFEKGTGRLLYFAIGDFSENVQELHSFLKRQALYDPGFIDTFK